MNKTTDTQTPSLPLIIEPLENRIAPATFLVTNLGDADVEGSLRHAIEQANAAAGADEIDFSSVHGSIKLGADLPTITDSLTISGPGGGKLAINGNNHAIFAVIGSALEVSISGLTLTKGHAANGGAVFVNDTGGNVNLSKLTISGNQAIGTLATADSDGIAGKGGGLYVQDGTINIQTTKISGNKTLSSESLYNSNTGVSTVKPIAGGQGGGVYIAEAGAANIQSSKIQGNVTGELGGGIFNKGITSLNKTTISGNQAKAAIGAEARGGGIYNGGSGQVTVTSSKISGNKVTGGNGLAAVYYYGGSSEAIEAGGAKGGGIYSGTGATLSVTAKSIISGNQVIGGKGANGVRGEAGEAGDLYGNPRGGNGSAGGAGHAGGSAQGGGLFNQGTLTLETSKITGNSAIGGAGGNGGHGGNGGAGANGTDATLYYGKITPATPGKAGGKGGPGGKGGAGGVGSSEGIFDSTGTSLVGSKITGNIHLNGKHGANGLVGAAGRHGTPGKTTTGGGGGGGGGYYGGGYYGG